MDARSIIAAIRDGQALPADALGWFAAGLADGQISDAQAGAFAMAVLLNGLPDTGRVDLTTAMRDSGTCLSWDLPGPVIDKHSTGGVGDCVSLVLAPALAACGAYVPMISGRGLGHTGGTLDKLEAIPGLRTEVDPESLRKIVSQAGCAIASATGQIAPADKRLYAIRDVTGTVESLDLITASILSKKLAAGLEGLVLDVKTGSGAFMKSPDQARALAQALVETANAAGCKCSAVISDMNQPLAPAVGNALEVDAAMRVLTGQTAGQTTQRLADLSAALGGLALAQAGMVKDIAQGATQMIEAITTGRAAEHFGRMIAAMGGPVKFVDHWTRFLPEATVIREVTAPRAGYVNAMDGQTMGLAVIDLGGGRLVETDRVDPSVGLSDVVPLGTWIDKGAPLARIHATRVDHAQTAEVRLLSAITLSDKAPDTKPLVYEQVG